MPISGMSIVGRAQRFRVNRSSARPRAQFGQSGRKAPLVTVTLASGLAINSRLLGWTPSLRTLP